VREKEQHALVSQGLIFETEREREGEREKARDRERE